VVLVFVGFAGSAFNREKEWSGTPGQAVEFHGYELTFKGLRTYENSTVESVGAEVAVSRDRRDLASLLPQKNWYRKSEQMASEVAIHSAWNEDLYVVLADVDLDAERASFKAFKNPLVGWYWTGGIVVFLGGILVLLPGRRREEP
jgi:cytochrome c-type biogenesis protein CcmF